MKCIILIISLCSIIFLRVFGQDYYWSAGEKHFLTDAPNTFIVKPQSNVTDALILQVATSVNDLKIGKINFISNKPCCIKKFKFVQQCTFCQKIG